MESLSTSLILLLIALVLLWLAVTDKLTRVLDAWDIIIGKTTTMPTIATTGAPLTTFHLPSLPPLVTSGNVPAVS